MAGRGSQKQCHGANRALRHAQSRRKTYCPTTGAVSLETGDTLNKEVTDDEEDE